MSIWTKNILEFKLVRILIVLGVIAFSIIYLINYNSLENKCRRQIEKASSYLPNQSSNKLQQLQLESAKKQAIEECIKNKSMK